MQSGDGFGRSVGLQGSMSHSFQNRLLFPRSASQADLLTISDRSGCDKILGDWPLAAPLFVWGATMITCLIGKPAEAFNIKFLETYRCARPIGYSTCRFRHARCKEQLLHRFSAPPVRLDARSRPDCCEVAHRPTLEAEFRKLGDAEHGGIRRDSVREVRCEDRDDVAAIAQFRGRLS